MVLIAARLLPTAGCAERAVPLSWRSGLSVVVVPVRLWVWAWGWGVGGRGGPRWVGALLTHQALYGRQWCAAPRQV